MKRGKRVVLVSTFDYAGSGYRIVEAVNLHTNHFVEYICMFPTPWVSGFRRYPTIFKRQDDGNLKIYRDDVDRLNMILEEADIIHVKGDDTPPTDEMLMSRMVDHGIEVNTGYKLLLPKVPRIVSVSGSVFRNKWHPVEEYIKPTQLRTSLNPDMNYPELKGVYTQFSYDTKKFKNTWTENETLLIGHSPSDMSKKGTKYLIEAVSELQRRGIKVDIDIMTNIPHEEVMKRKAECSIFFDQAVVGSYGNSAVEAMSMGIPVMTYLPEKSIRQSNGKLVNSPVINCGSSTEGMIGAILEVLKTDLSELSIKTKEWVDNHHSYETTGEMWGNIYASL